MGSRQYTTSTSFTSPQYSSPTFPLSLFLVSFLFSKKHTYCPSVSIIYFRGNLISSRPIDFKISMNVRYGVVHVQMA